ncbi:MAG: hypothetical protein WB439_04690 [Acidobacteriaceae bacterium]
MRSLIFALALAAPVSAVAATPTYSNPLNRSHHEKVQEVSFTFVSFSAQDREVVIGNQEYKVSFLGRVNVHAPVGTPVFLRSQTNPTVNGQELMRVSANDSDKFISLR